MIDQQEYRLELEKALVGWEGDGARAVPTTPNGIPLAACLPVLPAGYEAQPVWRFEDEQGPCSFEFNHVYTHEGRLRRRGSVAVGLLDEERSFWVATWPVLHRSGEEQPAARWLSFAEARKQQGAGLSFAHFSSVQYMRKELAAQRAR